MKLALIAIGQAGGKIADKFLERQKQTGGEIITDVLAVNTAKADLQGLSHIPEDRRILVGQHRVKGHGVGADNELGAEVMEEDINEVQNAVDTISTAKVDAFLVVAALGGGTGSGGAPVVAKHLQTIYTEPVYGLGILPAKSEGGIYTLNAARSFKTFVDEVDNLILFDNDAWRQSGDSLQDGFDELNEKLVRRLDVLFSAGELDEGDAVGESVVDASEIINTLGSSGISTIGFATNTLEPESGGLLGRFRDTGPKLDDADATNMVTSLTRKASLGRLTLPCEIGSAERALVVIGGPPGALNRKGVEKSRRWVEEQTGSMEVRGGDYPLPDSNQVAGLVVLSGVTDIPRIKELQGVAVEAKDNIEQLQQQHEEDLDELVNDDSDDLKPLF